MTLITKILSCQSNELIFGIFLQGGFRNILYRDFNLLIIYPAIIQILLNSFFNILCLFSVLVVQNNFILLLRRNPPLFILMLIDIIVTGSHKFVCKFTFIKDFFLDSRVQNSGFYVQMFLH